MSAPAFTPPDLADAFPIFHWSPTSRRKQINRYGMRVGMWSPDRAWRPPCTCWATDPLLAWTLSAANHPEITSWDLWLTWSNVPSGMEAMIDYYIDTRRQYVKEYRVYERIYKRDLWLAGTRTTPEP